MNDLKHRVIKTACMQTGMMFCQSPAAELRTWKSKSKTQNLGRLGLMVKFSVPVQLSHVGPITEKYICSWGWFKSFLSKGEEGCPRPSIYFCVLPTARVSGAVANQTKLEFYRGTCGRITNDPSMWTPELATWDYVISENIALAEQYWIFFSYLSLYYVFFVSF